MRTPKRRRRQLAMSELVLGVAGSYAVTAPGTEDELRRKYRLGQDDMDRIKAEVGDRLEKWALRLGYDQHWDDDYRENE
jgi:hypothetical protein